MGERRLLVKEKKRIRALEGMDGTGLRTEEMSSVGAPRSKRSLTALYRVNVRRICKCMEMGKDGWREGLIG